MYILYTSYDVVFKQHLQIKILGLSVCETRNNTVV